MTLSSQFCSFHSLWLRGCLLRTVMELCRGRQYFPTGPEWFNKRKLGRHGSVTLPCCSVQSRQSTRTVSRKSKSCSKEGGVDLFFVACGNILGTSQRTCQEVRFSFSRRKGFIILLITGMFMLEMGLRSWRPQKFSSRISENAKLQRQSRARCLNLALSQDSQN